MADIIREITLRAGNNPVGTLGTQGTTLSNNIVPTTLSNEVIEDINLGNATISRAKNDNNNFLGTTETFNQSARQLTQVVAGISSVQSVTQGINQSKNGYDTASTLLGATSLVLAFVPGGLAVSVAITAIGQPLLKKGSEVTEKNRVAKAREEVLGARLNKR